MNLFSPKAADIFNILADGHWEDDRLTAFKNIFSETLPRQLAYLEAGLITVEGKMLAGDYAIASVLDIAVLLEPTALDSFPGQLSGYERSYRMIGRYYLCAE